MNNLTELSFIVGGEVLTEKELLKKNPPVKRVRVASDVKKFKGFIVTGITEDQISEFIRTRAMMRKTRDDLTPIELRNLALRNCRGKRLHKPFNLPQAAQEFAAMAVKEGYINVSVLMPEME